MAQPSRTNGKGRSRPSRQRLARQADGGTPARDYSIAAVGRALDLLEALSRIGPAPLAALAKPGPMHSYSGVSACCARWRHAASPSRMRRAGCGGSEPAGASLGRAAVEQGALAATAMPVLAALGKTCGENVYLRVRDGLESETIAIYQADPGLRV